MSISLNATHPSNSLTEYDLHSLYGHSEGKATFEIMTNQSTTPNKNKRPFLLARSTFAGSGQYVQHWLGDNHRTWDDMRYSIAGVMNFNMFGIPMVGPDTCGFFGVNGQDELCARWIQLATFYPFARQHRDISGGGDPNEPWRLQEPYKSMARNALYDRLQYSRQMYTCLFETSQFGGTCFDPVAFRFPELDGAHEDYEQQFIAAGWFLVTPVLTPDA
jgi:alpha-glucosidase (family GH31 glycosyl hydrolase)